MSENLEIKQILSKQDIIKILQIYNLRYNITLSIPFP